MSSALIGSTPLTGRTHPDATTPAPHPPPSNRPSCGASSQKQKQAARGEAESGTWEDLVEAGVLELVAEAASCAEPPGVGARALAEGALAEAEVAAAVPFAPRHQLARRPERTRRPRRPHKRPRCLLFLQPPRLPLTVRRLVPERGGCWVFAGEYPILLLGHAP
eukprot:3937271-Rhodomonas_salina.3